MTLAADFRIPFATGTNPHADAAESGYLSWLHEMGLVPAEVVEGVRSWRLAGLLGTLFPAATRQQLELVTEWTTWGILLDDRFEGETRPDRLSRLVDGLVELMYRLPDSADRGADPIERALVDIMRRFRGLASPRWYARFTQRHVAWWCACVRERVAQLAGRDVSLKEYLVDRRYTVGMETYADVTELVLGSELPETVLGTRQLQTVRTSLWQAVAAFNDVYSLPKDRQNGWSHNMVRIIERVHGCDETEAVARVCRFANEAMDRFLAARAELPELLRTLALPGPTRANVESYVDSLGTCIRGAHDLHLASGRYRHG